MSWFVRTLNHFRDRTLLVDKKTGETVCEICVGRKGGKMKLRILNLNNNRFILKEKPDD